MHTNKALLDMLILAVMNVCSGIIIFEQNYDYSFLKVISCCDYRGTWLRQRNTMH